MDSLIPVEDMVLSKHKSDIVGQRWPVERGGRSFLRDGRLVALLAFLLKPDRAR